MQPLLPLKVGDRRVTRKKREPLGHLLTAALPHPHEARAPKECRGQSGEASAWPTLLSGLPFQTQQGWESSPLGVPSRGPQLGAGRETGNVPPVMTLWRHGRSGGVMGRGRIFSMPPPLAGHRHCLARRGCLGPCARTLSWSPPPDIVLIPSYTVHSSQDKVPKPAIRPKCSTGSILETAPQKSEIPPH